MEIHPLVRLEWQEDHRLSRRSLIWIRDHADPDDLHPIRTMIDLLRGATKAPTLGCYPEGGGLHVS